MTRFARGGSANKKKPYEGSTWEDLSIKKKFGQSHGVYETEETKEVKKSKKDNVTEPSQKATSDAHKTRTQVDKVPKELKHISKVKKRDKQRLKDRQRERRRQRRKQERDMAKVCYNCREAGHHLADCPQIMKDQEQGTGICFKCGSTEHSSGKCHVKVALGVYPFAKCFICGEKGHISKKCPDNPRGLYPKGGCCKQCGSVEHFRRDCPELQKQQGIQDVTLETISSCQSADSHAEPTQEYLPVSKKKKKVVNF
ncbi:zinc finger CCHC domain-containing protein 9-like [Liolophura sinensis]|uniref:zinc finger CCHC domain-containing protein 9-like n=1 Tax=Liolophura sinensis TaxID=3198878 RepID=UPI003158F81A